MSAAAGPMIPDAFVECTRDKLEKLGTMTAKAKAFAECVRNDTSNTIVKEMIKQLDVIGRNYWRDSQYQAYGESVKVAEQTGEPTIAKEELDSTRKRFNIHFDEDMRHENLPSLIGHSGLLEIAKLPEIVIHDPSILAKESPLFQLQHVPRYRSELVKDVEMPVGADPCKFETELREEYKDKPGEYSYSIRFSSEGNLRISKSPSGEFVKDEKIYPDYTPCELQQNYIQTARRESIRKGEGHREFDVKCSTGATVRVKKVVSVIEVFDPPALHGALIVPLGSKQIFRDPRYFIIDISSGDNDETALNEGEEIPDVYLRVRVPTEGKSAKGAGAGAGASRRSRGGARSKAKKRKERGSRTHRRTRRNRRH